MLGAQNKQIVQCTFRNGLDKLMKSKHEVEEAMASYRGGNIPGHFGPESFRPWVVSAWVISAWVVSALGRFGQFWVVVSA